LDPTYLNALGLKFHVILSAYVKWKSKCDIEDHDECNLITFIEQVNDEETSNYFTDAILEDAKN
jgi:hypothetical protein